MPTIGPLRPWEIASVVFFAYTVAATMALPGLAGRRRGQALAGAAAGIGLAIASTLLPATPVMHDWLFPPALLLLAYWSSGRLFVAPMARAERALLRVDEALGIRKTAGRTPRIVAELLEIAYVGVYPVIPIALTIFLLETPSPDPARFWTIVLVTDYICFGVLPWVQTRPPRALDPAPPWRSSFRAVNLHLLGTTSIQVNTFPSGHAAEAVAVALLVAAAPWPLAAAVAIAALLVSAGAVLGRYHYAADAFAGWGVAVVVWVACR